MNTMWSAYVLIKLLVWRELRLMGESALAIGGSAAVYSFLLAISSGYFMPQLGLTPEGILPIFLGSFAVTCITLGYSGALDIAYDLHSPQLGAYYAMLPVHFGAVVVSRVAVVFVRLGMVVIPLLIGGLCIINRWQFFSIAPIGACLVVFLSLLFNALLFLVLAHACSLTVFLGNVWPRVVVPLFSFGCSMYSWRSVAAHSPFLSKVLLLSPLTYCSEGLRSALLGGSYFISWKICVSVLALLNGCMSVLLWWAMLKALNPVVTSQRSVCK